MDNNYTNNYNSYNNYNNYNSYNNINDECKCEGYNCYVTKYWLYCQFGGKYRWNTLSHNGVLFPPPYEKHDIPVIYKGERIVLDKLAEEAATLYARYTDTEYIKSKVFKKNFWSDWKKLLGKNSPIIDLDDVDFSLIHEYILKEKEAKRSMSKEEKEKLKEEREKEEAKYKIAIVDGVAQPVGNFRMEPPGIFIGRGCHPKLGKIKPRFYPEDITINIGKEAPIPETMEGHKWGQIIHNRRVEWLASWKDAITGKTKYVWLGAHSKFQAESDQSKFDLARKLKKKVKGIRETNYKNLSDTDLKTRQIATALYFIDELALRVGNEKGSDAADTVGVTNLRVEHIKLDGGKVTLDFLGKDSIRYVKKFSVDKNVYNNLSEFMKEKLKDEQLFEKINSNDINKYLQSFMKGLTAKVFRTYNASYLFQKELSKITKKYANFGESEDIDKVNILLDEFNKANVKVALLCNHKKAVSKSFNQQIDKINDSIKATQNKIRKLKKQAKDSKSKSLKKRLKKAKEQLKKIKAKKSLKVDLKDVSLGTSKVNYIDPRITVAFLKKHDLPVDKVFSKTLQDKFKWAFEVDKDYKF